MTRARLRLGRGAVPLPALSADRNTLSRSQRAAGCQARHPHSWANGRSTPLLSPSCEFAIGECHFLPKSLSLSASNFAASRHHVHGFFSAYIRNSCSFQVGSTLVATADALLPSWRLVAGGFPIGGSRPSKGSRWCDDAHRQLVPRPGQSFAPLGAPRVDNSKSVPN